MKMYYKFGQLFDIIDGDRGINYPKDSDFYEEGYCLFLNAGNVTKNGWSFENNVFITEEKDKQLRNGRVNRGNTVLTTRGTVGNAAYYNDRITYDHLRINSGMVILSAKDNGIIDNEFIYYLVTSPIARKTIELFCSGSAQPQLPIKDFVKIKYDLPSIEKQRKTVSILSTYDRLIEINNKRIKVLEQMAENLYKEWFVRFRFPGHETTEFENGLPKGWKTQPLLSWLIDNFNGGWGEDEGTPNAPFVAHVIRGTDIEEVKKSRYSDIPCRFHKRKDIETKQLHENDIILELSNGNINNIGRTLFVGKDILSHFEYVMCASFCKTLRFENRYIAFYVWKYIEYLQNSGLMFFYKNTGSNGINNFNFKKFLRMPITIPNDFSYIEPLVDYYKQASNIREMNYNLVQQRDLLLPRLMSGKLEV